MANVPKRHVQVHIPSEYGYEKVAMEAAAATAKEMGFSYDRIQDLKTAVSEACLNAIEHGNQLDANTKVVVALKVQPASLEINVADEGKQLFSNCVKPDHPKDHRGWGMFLIENLVDEVQVRAEPGGGNVVRMIIHLDR